MPKRTLTQSVTLIRDNQRVTLEAGKTHELSADEINDIVAVSPGALSTTATVDLAEQDVTDVVDKTEKQDPPVPMTAAEKKAAEKAAKEAQKAATGPSTSGESL